MLATPAAPLGIDDPLIAAEPARLRGDQRALLAVTLERAPEHGLPAVIATGMGDVELERAIIAYAAAMRGQRLAGRFPKNWSVRPQPYDAASEYRRALAADQLKPWLTSLASPHPGYRQLVAALARYRNIDHAGGWPDLASGAALKPGARHPRIAALRRRIAIETDVVLDSADEELFDAGLAEALKAEQARLGVPATGVLDKATVAAFNVPARERIEAIEANLERWRWLPAALPAYRVEVNIAGAELEVWRGGDVVMAMRTIVGKKATPTPLLQTQIETVVLNPPWNVPPSIARNEILPKAAADPRYLARHGYIRLPSGGLQQKAGPQSALGQVKFDMPNPFTVYLHDTPSRGLFARDVRTLSHGCMRVEKPIELARLVLADNPDWTPAAIDAAIASGKTIRAPVRTRPAVLVVYRTAFVRGGQVHFRNDVYDWDEKLRRLLGR
ncbi:MAG TPA: L,D-transpeptidase family protein [Caulobacteraceae bacterium]|nr:L,D-transpeptidase family protein [Caulobacteraceae bacterium]